MPSVDFGQDYVGGLTIPAASEEGFPAIVGAPGPNGSLAWIYARDARPPAFGADKDSFDLFPTTFRVQTIDATPQRVVTLTCPANYEMNVRISATAKQSGSQRRMYVRGRFENVGAGPVALYGGSGFITEETDVGALTVGGVTKAFISTGVQIFVTGAASPVKWTVQIKRDLVRMNMP